MHYDYRFSKIENTDTVYNILFKLIHFPFTQRRLHMEKFSSLLALCEGNHMSPAVSPHKGSDNGALVFSFLLA